MIRHHTSSVSTPDNLLPIGQMFATLQLLRVVLFAISDSFVMSVVIAVWQAATLDRQAEHTCIDKSEECGAIGLKGRRGSVGNSRLQIAQPRARWRHPKACTPSSPEMARSSDHRGRTRHRVLSRLIGQQISAPCHFVHAYSSEPRLNCQPTAAVRQCPEWHPRRCKLPAMVSRPIAGRYYPNHSWPIIVR